MKTFNTLLSTALLSLIVVTAAHATDVEAPKSLTVQFADLDLNRTEGVTMLFNRIKGAARNVCRPLTGASLREKELHATCIEFALSNAVARVDRPVLTQYVASHSRIEPTAPIQVASGR